MMIIQNYTFFEYKLIYLGQQNKGIKGLPN